jgi:peptide/nickel transport system ATP-binding protein
MLPGVHGPVNASVSAIASGVRSEPRAVEGQAVLRVRDLVVTVRLGEREIAAVDGVSFDVPAGRTLGLVGESGSGKSLTALAIMRLLPEPQVRITGGQVLFDDRDLARLPDAALQKLRGNRLAMVFQEPSTALNPVFPVGSQVGEPLRIHRGQSREQALTEAVRLLELVNIPAAAERARAYPHQLSGGMKQRAMIAMALACRPALLVADEPTTALDVTVQAQILALLGRLQRELGMALLLITHDLGVVAETCDEVAVMYAGRIVERGPAATVLAGPRHPYTAGLLASMRTLEASTSGGASAGRLREIRGTVPALGRLPPGCAFADRCDRVQPSCRLNPPLLLPPSMAGGRLAPPEVKRDQEASGSGVSREATVARCFFPVEPAEGPP